jgi:hypothetical protein
LLWLYFARFMYMVSIEMNIMVSPFKILLMYLFYVDSVYFAIA